MPNPRSAQDCSSSKSGGWRPQSPRPSTPTNSAEAPLFALEHNMAFTGEHSPTLPPGKRRRERPPRTLRGVAPHKPSLRTGSSWRARRHAPNAAPQLAYSRRADAAEADDRTGTGSFRAVATKPSFQLLISPFTLPLLHLNPRQAAQATNARPGLSGDIDNPNSAETIAPAISCPRSTRTESRRTGSNQNPGETAAC